MLTNVLIDFLCKREPFYENAKKVFALGLLGKHELVVSALTVADTMYVARKYDRSKVSEGLKSMFEFISVVDFTGSAAKEAIAIGWNDYEDSIQYITAKEAGCSCIVTRNEKDFKKSSLAVCSPEKFINLPID